MPRVVFKIVEQAGVNLINYVILIRLEDHGLYDVFNYTQDTIYFTDENGNPLYYYIRKFDTVNKVSEIYVKIPSIPANGTVTIYMYYSEANPYTEYNDPNNVFILYDDFSTFDTSKWTISNGSPTVINGVLRLTGDNGDSIKSTSIIPANVKIIVKLMFERFGIYGPRFSVSIRMQNDRWYSFANEQGNVNTSIGYYNIKKFVDGAVTHIGIGSRKAYYIVNAWYEEEVMAYGNNLKWLIQRGTEVLSGVDSEITDDGYISIDTWDVGNIVNVDEIMVMPYVDPEPTVQLQTDEDEITAGLYVTQVAQAQTEVTAGLYVTQVAQPLFRIVSYTQNVSATPSSTFTVDVTVQNIGDAQGTVEVRLKDPNGTVVDSRQIVLSAGAQQTVTLSAIAPATEGTYTYTVEAYNVDTADVDDTVNVTVNVVAVGPVFRITSAPTNITATSGQVFNVSITVSNVGNAGGTVEIRLRDHNGVIMASTQRTVAQGASTTVTLSAIAPGTPGTYTWIVEAYNVTSGVVDDSANIMLNVTAQQKKTEIPWLLLLVLGGVLLLARRKEK